MTLPLRRYKLPLEDTLEIDGPSAPERLCKEPKCPAERRKRRNYCTVHQAVRDEKARKRRIQRLDAERRRRWRIAKTAEMERRKARIHRKALAKQREEKKQELPE